MPRPGLQPGRGMRATLRVAHPHVPRPGLPAGAAACEPGCLRRTAVRRAMGNFAAG